MVNNSRFQKNTSTGAGDNDGGGAIHSSSGQVTLNKVRLLKNVTATHGGGVYADGTLMVINDSPISKNTISNENVVLGNGGGIYNQKGNLTIARSMISDHKEGSKKGGGIWHDQGDLTIRDSSILGNTTNESGGGIYASDSSIYTTLRLINSTIAENTSDGNGGGIYSKYRSASIINATISGNTSATHGGGVYSEGKDNKIEFVNSTIANNSAGSDTGGGIYSVGKVTLANSLVIRNTAATGANLYTTSVDSFISKGNNLFGENGSAGVSDSATELRLGPTDIVLPGGAETVIDDLLTDNGGPTKTHFPVANSLIVDGGNDALIPEKLTTDQRGYGPRIMGNAVDMGAVELDASPPSYPVSVSHSGVGSGVVTSAPVGISCPPTCTVDFPAHSSVTLMAVADTGDSFSGWQDECTGTTATCTLTINALKHVTALFANAPAAVLLRLSKMGTGSGTISGGGNYAVGATVTLNATAAAGSKFVAWSPSPCAASFKMPAKALTCTANFALAPVGFALNTLVAGTGTGTVTGAGKYAAGAMVTLKATPAKGSSFVDWAPTACSPSFFMPDRALTCVAIFSNSAHTLTTVMGGLGTGTVTGVGSYAAGARVTLTATPAAGSTFVGWTPAPCGASFVMPAHALVCAAIFN